MGGDSGNPKRISSSTVKTYSRRSTRNIEKSSAKRRHVEEIPPTDLQLPPVKKPRHASIADYYRLATVQLESTQLSSDSIDAHSTPPSSPPPPQSSRFDIQTRVKRRLTTRPYLPPTAKMQEPLTEKTNVTTTTPVATGLVTRKTSAAMLVQTQLASTRVVCNKCEMIFDKAVSSDVWTHEKFHNKKMNGFLQAESLDKGIEIWSEITESNIVSSIRTMDRNCNPAWRAYFEEALRYTYRNGLGATPIEPEDLWAACTDPHNPSNPIPLPKYKFFVKIVGGNIIGLLLAKLAKESGWYFNGMVCCNPYPDGWIRGPGTFPEKNVVQQFICHDDSRPAYMSVDHLWIASSHRRTGCATQLLDLARDHFISGKKLAHEDICFSIPTLDGERFAKRYCYNKIGFGTLDHEHTNIRVNLEEPGPIVKNGYLQGDMGDSLHERLESYVLDDGKEGKE